MSAKRPTAPGTVHPVAKPFQRLSGARTGLFVLAALVLVLLISFAVELVMTGGEGWSKYPEVLGGYEVLPGLALAAAILIGWAVRALISASPGFYERGDTKTRDGLTGGTVGRAGEERSAPRD
ncbi:MAG: hypothetical protein ABL308_10150 [Oceanicaulis sp.]